MNSRKRRSRDLDYHRRGRSPSSHRYPSEHRGYNESKRRRRNNQYPHRDEYGSERRDNDYFRYNGHRDRHYGGRSDHHSRPYDQDRRYNSRSYRSSRDSRDNVTQSDRTVQSETVKQNEPEKQSDDEDFADFKLDTETEEERIARQREERRKRFAELRAKKAAEASESTLESNDKPTETIDEDSVKADGIKPISEEISTVKDNSLGMPPESIPTQPSIEEGLESEKQQQQSSEDFQKEKDDKHKDDDDGEEEVDLFNSTADEIVRKVTSDKLSKSSASMAKNEAWDDSEGYYVLRIGDILDDRYRVVGEQGRGMFSSVLRVQLLVSQNGSHHHSSSNPSSINNGHLSNKDDEQYVVKIVRSNEHMIKSGFTEIDHLLCVAKEKDSHIVRLLDHFWHVSHLCLVFEAMDCNLRQLLRKVGAGRGFHIQAICSYARQLCKALLTLRKLKLIHTDLKPDNILVSLDRRTLKVCDFGSALKLSEVVITPLLGSRFYRAFESMIGLKWDMAVDVWSTACVFAELYSGAILFEGANNNEMIKLQLQVSGGVSSKVIANGQFYSEHFNDEGVFLEDVMDEVQQLPLKSEHPFRVGQPTRSLQECLHPNSESVKLYHALSPALKSKVELFKDLLSKMLILDPSKRITPKMALRHPFIVGKK